MENTIIIEKTDTGLSAYSTTFEGIYTSADSFEELKENIEEVIAEQVVYLREMNETTEADELEQSEVIYGVDLKQFFEYYSMINKSEFAKYIGINESLMRQYSRGITNVSDDRMLKIQNGLHRLASDLKRVSFV